MGSLTRVQILKDKKNVAMDSYLAEQDLEMKQDIKNKFEGLKQEIVEAEKAVTEAQNFEKDFDEFIIYAFDIMDNLGTKWWQQDKTTMRVYKQMLFPAGIQLSPDKKVYIPEISAIYRYGGTKKAPEGADFTNMEGPVGFEPTTRGLKGRCSNLLSYGPSSGARDKPDGLLFSLFEQSAIYGGITPYIIDIFGEKSTVRTVAAKN